MPTSNQGAEHLPPAGEIFLGHDPPNLAVNEANSIPMLEKNHSNQKSAIVLGSTPAPSFSSVHLGGFRDP